MTMYLSPGCYMNVHMCACTFTHAYIPSHVNMNTDTQNMQIINVKALKYLMKYDSKHI